jgi:arabinogalactan endo-1,4-beta-galactosidase
MGFCYWGAEYVAFNGPESSHGSSWENQALFNFNNETLSAIEAFNLK